MTVVIYAHSPRFTDKENKLFGIVRLALKPKTLSVKTQNKTELNPIMDSEAWNCERETVSQKEFKDYHFNNAIAKTFIISFSYSIDSSLILFDFAAGRPRRI